MEQYISKSALVAKVLKRREINKKNKLNLAAAFEDNYLLSFIDTLEVKEVDLEKEIRTEIDEYWYDNDYGAIQRHGGTITMEVSDVKEIAKHFFELGIKAAQKGK